MTLIIIKLDNCNNRSKNILRQLNKKTNSSSRIVINKYKIDIKKLLVKIKHKLNKSNKSLYGMIFKLISLNSNQSN